jgi:diguanylate cyclase (GGDEF)-like protein/PAS domain S-box-containing protein
MLDNLEIAQRELSESELRFRSFVTHSYDGIIILNEQGKIVLWNKSMEKLFSTPADQVMGKLLIEVLWNYSPLKNTLGDLTFHRFKRRISAYFKAIQRKRHIKNVELQLMSNKTNKMYIELTAFPITTFERPLFGIILRNITHRKNLEEKLNYLSTHDSLTKLYNRYFFDTEMERFQDSRLFPISIILFDIDNLKITNDTYGHSFGDKILVNFSNILLQSFDEDILARIGGDGIWLFYYHALTRNKPEKFSTVFMQLNEYNKNISIFLYTCLRV